MCAHHDEDIETFIDKYILCCKRSCLEAEYTGSRSVIGAYHVGLWRQQRQHCSHTRQLNKTSHTHRAKLKAVESTTSSTLRSAFVKRCRFSYGRFPRSSWTRRRQSSRLTDISFVAGSAGSTVTQYIPASASRWRSSDTAPIRATLATSRRPKRKVSRMAHAVRRLNALASNALPCLDAKEKEIDKKYISAIQNILVPHEEMEIREDDERRRSRFSLYPRLSLRYQIRSWILLCSSRRRILNPQLMLRLRGVGRENCKDGDAHLVAYPVCQVRGHYDYKSSISRGQLIKKSTRKRSSTLHIACISGW